MICCGLHRCGIILYTCTTDYRVWHGTYTREKLQLSKYNDYSYHTNPYHTDARRKILSLKKEPLKFKSMAHYLIMFYLLLFTVYRYM